MLGNIRILIPSAIISYYGCKSNIIHCLNESNMAPIMLPTKNSFRLQHSLQIASNPANEESYSMFQSLYMMARWCCLGCVFSPFIATSPFLNYFQSDLKRYWWDSFRYAICMTGPCEIKLAQWAATRRDIFDRNTCDELGQLQTNAHRHPWDQTERTLSAAIGSDWRDKIEIIHDVGCGCVAQVYKGKLKVNINQRFKAGDEVAVKVIHSNVSDDINSDLLALNWLARCVEYWWPQLKFASVTDNATEFSNLMTMQTDLRRESQSLERFNNNFSSFLHIRFPIVCKELSSRFVLVETFEEGYPVNEAINCCDDQTKKKLASVGLSAFFKMLFHDNFVHADLHPGNILVHDPRLDRDMSLQSDDDPVIESNTTNVGKVSSWLKQLMKTIKRGGRHSDEVELVLLDAGLTTSLNSTDMTDFIDLFHAIIQGNGNTVADLLMERGGNSQLNSEVACNLITLEQQKEFKESFRKEICEVVNDATAGLLLRRIQVSHLLERVLNACCTYHIRLSPKFASVILSTAVLEGLGRSLDPDVDILKIATPYIIDAHFMNF